MDNLSIETCRVNEAMNSAVHVSLRACFTIIITMRNGPLYRPLSSGISASSPVTNGNTTLPILSMTHFYTQPQSCFQLSEIPFTIKNTYGYGTAFSHAVGNSICDVQTNQPPSEYSNLLGYWRVILCDKRGLKNLSNIIWDEKTFNQWFKQSLIRHVWRISTPDDVVTSWHLLHIA